jgi:transcription elongation factor GreA
MHDKQYLTKEKFDELTTELKELSTTRRRELAVHLEYARSLGDLSENAEYHQAREDQAISEDRIARLESLLKHAEIVKQHHSDSVELGTTATVQKVGDKEKKEYIIVGSEEADMLAGKVSHISPLGRAIVGTKKGDIFTFSTPKGEVQYKVISIK